MRAHYAKNMVIILPRPSKTAPCIWNTRDTLLLCTATVFLSFLFISLLLRRAAAFRARVYSFSLFKAPHLPRSWEHTPDPADAADWIQIRLLGTGMAQRNSRRISDEKQECARRRGRLFFSLEKRDLRVISKISRAFLFFSINKSGVDLLSLWNMPIRKYMALY